MSRFFSEIRSQQTPVYLSVITIGELTRGVELIRYRRDLIQATQLEQWLAQIKSQFQAYILPFDQTTSQIWGVLRVPHPEHAIDKQIAATAMQHQLTLVTRNIKDFEGCGVKLFNPFD